jgi:hypothetical protein
LDFDLGSAVSVLACTPQTLKSLLEGLPRDWHRENEGPDTWSPFDVVGHLVHGERTDWMPRARIILEQGAGRTFETFDRHAQFTESHGRTIEELLETFARLRAQNLDALRVLHLSPADLAKKGRHPELGEVTLRQLIAAWVVHDLDHVQQIARTMARQYADEVGPWKAYLRILQKTQGA